jgi:ubiquinone/menaquinone biosynthesis C-methylase UbiE
MWTPRFACPRCQGPLADGELLACSCGAAFARVEGTYRFLCVEHQLKLRAFAEQYSAVRCVDGHRGVIAECWRTLPYVPPKHATAGEWRIRHQSWGKFASRVLSTSRRRILDLGAGSGWLSSRCASMNHHVVAVDRFDDESDARAMRNHDGPPFVVVQADFDALPFEPFQFDVAVFNASLHYAEDPDRTLARAEQMLSPGGLLVVMDSPMFRETADGEAMVASQLAQFSATSSISNVIRPGAGYLTFDGLDRAARRLGRSPQFVPSRGPFAWRMRRRLAPFRLGRAPASFGVWVAE